MPRMPTPVQETHVASTHADPYQRAAFTLSNRLRRLFWGITWALLGRFSPRPFFSWRALLLRSFGAQLGPGCHVYPKARIWAPWNLYCADHVAISDDTEIYNPSPLRLASHVILSQGSFICGATHDYNSAAFPMVSYAMHFERYAWVCARASVGPGVNMGEGAVLGMSSVATRSLEPWTVYAGSPARKVKDRTRTIEDNSPMPGEPAS